MTSSCPDDMSREDAKCLAMFIGNVEIQPITKQGLIEGWLLKINNGYHQVFNYSTELSGPWLNPPQKIRLSSSRKLPKAFSVANQKIKPFLV